MEPQNDGTPMPEGEEKKNEGAMPEGEAPAAAPADGEGGEEAPAA